jgi:hypothetical protein
MEIQDRLWGHPQKITDTDDHDYNLQYDNDSHSIKRNTIINQHLIL